MFQNPDTIKRITKNEINNISNLYYIHWFITVLWNSIIQKVLVLCVRFVKCAVFQFNHFIIAITYKCIYVNTELNICVLVSLSYIVFFLGEDGLFYQYWNEFKIIATTGDIFKEKCVFI